MEARPRQGALQRELGVDLELLRVERVGTGPQEREVLAGEAHLHGLRVRPLLVLHPLQFPKGGGRGRAKAARTRVPIPPQIVQMGWIVVRVTAGSPRRWWRKIERGRERERERARER